MKNQKETPLFEWATGTMKVLAGEASGGVALSDFAKPTRVEPVVIVDRRTETLEYTEDVLHAVLNIFTGYYMQALTYLNLHAKNIDVMRRLDQINPNRSLTDTLLAMELDEQSSESMDPFSNGLPDYSQEADNATASASGDLAEKTNLSIGKQVQATFETKGEGGQSVTIPITVRLRSLAVRSSILAHTLTLDSKDDSLKERYHKWRAGQISFVKDLLLAQDLIHEHRQNLFDDTHGLYTDEIKRRRKSLAAGLTSNRMSLAAASNIYVMTSETENEVSRLMKGSFERARDRNELMHETRAMMFVVIDSEWEQVSIYTRDLDEPIELSVREIRRSNKKNDGPDILEVLNAMRQSRAPAL